jgi:ferredoxin--NADP+ reductase
MQVQEKIPVNIYRSYALSRKPQNPEGGKMYIQHRIAAQVDALWELIQQDNTHTYICGLKGMESAIDAGLSIATQKYDVDWNEYRKALKNSGRWHVETY